MKKILIIILMLAVFTGCSDKEKVIEVKKNINSVVSTDRYDEIINNNNYIVVDVRTKEEYEEGHVVGALNIPYDEIDENVDLDKNKTIMVYCKSGVRSTNAYNTLLSLGYDVYNLGAFSSIKLPKE